MTGTTVAAGSRTVRFEDRVAVPAAFEEEVRTAAEV